MVVIDPGSQSTLEVEVRWLNVGPLNQADQGGRRLPRGLGSRRQEAFGHWAGALFYYRLFLYRARFELGAEHLREEFRRALDGDRKLVGDQDPETQGLEAHRS